MVGIKNIARTVFAALLFVQACKKPTSDPAPAPPPAVPVSVAAVLLNGSTIGGDRAGIGVSPELIVRFSGKIDQSTIAKGITLTTESGVAVATTVTTPADSIVQLKPSSALSYLSRYTFSVTSSIRSASGAGLSNPVSYRLQTGVDPTDKFPLISNDALLTKIQQQTFNYFWNFGHPESGLARERNSSGETVTSGGSGFGIMTIPVAIERGFITRAEGYARMQKIVGFLTTKADRFHGAYSHWLDGSTGKVIPFSTKDDGADLVETSYLAMGLMTARQYFDEAGEASLRTDINTLLNGIEWDWFRQGSQNALYWHWSPNYGWDMNMPIRGWNEALITYVMAASSTTHTIPKEVYDAGWAQAGAMKNGASYYGYTLPLGPQAGGPLFFAHYSFLGIDPNQLADAYCTDYFLQNTNHALINHDYSVANPNGFYGYSDSCWGLTASDIPSGYTASSPTNDVGVIAPTAALASFPYTPDESMKAAQYFYYRLGDKLWGDYGFYDAFKLSDPWFATSTLAIDQGPIVIMIENYRSSLLWDLFMSSPEVKAGMKKLGFSSPKL